MHAGLLGAKLRESQSFRVDSGGSWCILERWIWEFSEYCELHGCLVLENVSWLGELILNKSNIFLLEILIFFCLNGIPHSMIIDYNRTLWNITMELYCIPFFPLYVLSECSKGGAFLGRSC